MRKPRGRTRSYKPKDTPEDILQGRGIKAKKVDVPVPVIVSRVRDDLVDRVEAALAKQIFTGYLSLEGIRDHRHELALAVIDTILPKSESGIRGRIIKLLSQPLVEPLTMEAVEEWKDMVAGQILAEVADNKPFKCELCDKEFKTSQGVGVHKARAHRIRGRGRPKKGKIPVEEYCERNSQSARSCLA